MPTQTPTEEAAMPSAPQPRRPVVNRRKLPHSVIVRAPGLLPMRYKPSELARHLGVPAQVVRGWASRGLPHERDAHGHVWIDGRACARWVEAERKARPGHKLAGDEAFCLGCNRPTPLRNPVRHTHGKWVRLSGTCPACGAKVNRGVRRDQP